MQNLRLTPRSFDSQYVLRWRLSVDVDGALRRCEDSLGNVVHAFSHPNHLERFTVSAVGEVETGDAVGVVRGAVEPLPSAMFLRSSPLAQANGALREFAADAVGATADRLERLHRLMAAVHAAMAYEPSTQETRGGAADAFALRRGDAGEFAHVFIACARVARNSRPLRQRLSRRRRAAARGPVRLGRSRSARPRLDRLRPGPQDLRRRALRQESQSVSTASARRRSASAIPSGAEAQVNAQVRD